MGSMNALNLHPADSLTRYLGETRKYPFLTAEQEIDFTRRWREQGDREALEQLVGSHLRLVVKMARNHAGYGLPLGDLISEGHVGLMQSVERYDPERGVRFATYAMWWIRAAIQEYVLRSWSLVKMGTTGAQKKLFFNLRRLKSRMHEFDNGDLAPETVAAIAEELDVPEADVVQMNRRLGSGDYSLNAAMGPEGEDEWQDLLPEDSPDQEALLVEADELAWRRRLLEHGLIKLNERERQILEQRRLKDNPLTLEVLSREYGISRERVRQIENRAFEKLERAMRNMALTGGLRRPAGPSSGEAGAQMA
ncbi:MAG: RNA polymerase sigma factor RpoH [Rhodospirillales bacterium]|nr:RNA polymerase sigma factor RpoH [Rhodospirillales bacterium]MDH3791150.1 RNA polymerase sigma factor RpoH [Rhodospirillales bacterium]MDH3912255.1 RNA polymerase sigma factor RpoH [Rhodospirillales bacterium]MDH3919532.1 RNA polymerase sigma factor RpoH [Rhodospirillales bacterium]MDH3969373.1 RNA polymerase sigma factor RpoH [Rhodospirillales bacterium]